MKRLLLLGVGLLQLIACCACAQEAPAVTPQNDPADTTPAAESVCTLDGDTVPVLEQVGRHIVWNEGIVLRQNAAGGTGDFFRLVGTELQPLPRNEVQMTLKGRELRFFWTKAEDRLVAYIPDYEVNTVLWSVQAPEGQNTELVIRMYDGESDRDATGDIYLYDVTTGKTRPLESWGSDIGVISACRFSPDLRSALLSADDGTEWYWDRTAGVKTPLSDWIAPEKGTAVWQTGFLNSGRLLIVTARTETTRVAGKVSERTCLTCWAVDPASGEKTCVLEETPRMEKSGDGVSLGDDSPVAGLRLNGVFYAVNLETGERLLLEQSEQVEHIQAYNGLIVGGFSDETMPGKDVYGLWDVNSGRRIRTLAIDRELSAHLYGSPAHNGVVMAVMYFGEDQRPENCSLRLYVW